MSTTLGLALANLDLGTVTFFGAVLIVLLPTMVMIVGGCVKWRFEGATVVAPRPARCATCGYDVRAAFSGRCSECGSACAPVPASTNAGG